MPLNFFFASGSITTLPMLIPVIQEINRRNVIPYLHMRNTTRKSYQDYKIHIDKFREMMKLINVILLENKPFPSKPGIIFVVDGDLMGINNPSYLKNRVKHTHPQQLMFSLSDNINYLNVYDNIMPYIDYIFLENPVYLTSYQKPLTKAIFAANPRYSCLENFTSNEDIYKKYQLDPTHKYILLMFPKNSFYNTLVKKKNVQFNKFIKRLAITCSPSGEQYHLLIKSAWRDGTKQQKYPVITNIDMYPNNSLELMKISDMVVLFSSACCEECVVSKTPFIYADIRDFNVFPFLQNPKFCHFGNYKKVLNYNSAELQNIINTIVPCPSTVFDETISTHMTPNRTEISKTAVDKAIQTYQKRFPESS